MLGLTLISSPFVAPITLALYVDLGDPTFVAVLLKTPLMEFGFEEESAKEG